MEVCTPCHLHFTPFPSSPAGIRLVFLYFVFCIWYFWIVEVCTPSLTLCPLSFFLSWDPFGIFLATYLICVILVFYKLPKYLVLIWGFLYSLGFSFISSDRSSCTDDGLLYIYIYISTHFFRFWAFMPFYTVTSVTLSRLNSINAIDVTGYL